MNFRSTWQHYVVLYVLASISKDCIASSFWVKLVAIRPTMWRDFLTKHWNYLKSHTALQPGRLLLVSTNYTATTFHHSNPPSVQLQFYHHNNARHLTMIEIQLDVISSNSFFTSTQAVVMASFSAMSKSFFEILRKNYKCSITINAKFH
jgi:hypothetical protein